MKTPVALVMFNRPHLTQRVLERIRDWQPESLYVIADGPRNENDIPKVDACHNLITTMIDWDCEVRYNYAQANMGVGERFPTGMDWLFSEVEQAIILEDDVLPELTMFPFCEELLTRYRDDERVGLISCINHEGAPDPDKPSYRFTHIVAHQGLAMWRRTWDNYEHDCKSYTQSETPKMIIKKRYPQEPHQSMYIRAVETATNPRNEAYDYKLSYSWTARGQWAINPNTNLCSNIGFGPDSTHCFDPNNPHANRQTWPMPFPLMHPEVPELVTA